MSGVKIREIKQLMYVMGSNFALSQNSYLYDAGPSPGSAAVQAFLYRKDDISEKKHDHALD